jgi:hypothetical protein
VANLDLWPQKWSLKANSHYLLLGAVRDNWESLGRWDGWVSTMSFWCSVIGAPDLELLDCTQLSGRDFFFTRTENLNNTMVQSRSVMCSLHRSGFFFASGCLWQWRAVEDNMSTPFCLPVFEVDVNTLLFILAITLSSRDGLGWPPVDGRNPLFGWKPLFENLWHWVCSIGGVQKG